MELRGRRRVRTLAFSLVLICADAAAETSDEQRCIEASARYNRLPPALLLAIRRQEAGRVGLWRGNADGSYDYGVMQINSRWLPKMEARGYTAQALVYDACASIAAGAWILAQALAAHGSWDRRDAAARAYWLAVGDYHSKTPALNRAYAERVWTRYLDLLREPGP
jgi:soluble lytic murein transglycosylase-like protein